eukprot:scaffold18951_cov63-Phaeocystis_antarctica.AAC.10
MLAARSGAEVLRLLRRACPGCVSREEEDGALPVRLDRIRRRVGEGEGLGRPRRDVIVVPSQVADERAGLGDGLPSEAQLGLPVRS